MTESQSKQEQKKTEDSEMVEMNKDNEMVEEAAKDPEETVEAVRASDAAEEVFGEVEEAEPEDEEVEDEEGEETPKAEKKSFFGKKKEKKDKKDVQIEELTDRLKRQMAEFDNFRKRTEKEKSSMYEIGARDILEKILPVVDNFERGLDGADQEDAFAAGMAMIYKQLITTLEEIGVKPIEAVGSEFDPSLHNAVMHVEEEEAGENVVVEEFQKGYTYRDSVIRHSMVKVAN